MADKVELDDLFVEELKPRATPISTVVATECCGTCNSSCRAQEAEEEFFFGTDAVEQPSVEQPSTDAADAGAQPTRRRAEDPKERKQSDAPPNVSS